MIPLSTLLYLAPSNPGSLSGCCILSNKKPKNISCHCSNVLQLPQNKNCFGCNHPTKRTTTTTSILGVAIHILLCYLFMLLWPESTERFNSRKKMTANIKNHTLLQEVCFHFRLGFFFFCWNCCSWAAAAS